MVEGDPVGPHLRAGHQSWGASLRRRPYFSVLLLPALVGSLPVVVLRLRVLSRGRVLGCGFSRLEKSTAEDARCM
jgi:hypothetical protein